MEGARQCRAVRWNYMSMAFSSATEWHLQALAAVVAWATPRVEVQVLRAHRRDHLLAVCTSGRQQWFVKAFHPASQADLHQEWSAYRRLAEVPAVPTLHYADPTSRLLITDFVAGKRLGALSGGALRRAIPGIPGLYASMTMGSPTAAPAHPEYRLAWSQMSRLPECAQLPVPDEVWPIVGRMAARHVHADFQPSNVLVGPSGLTAVDLESYGPDVPALDVARMAYNPAFDLDDGERDALAQGMLDRLEFDDRLHVSRRELAACCVMWAVTCAAYFTRVLATQPDVLMDSPEVAVLAREPLRLASQLWHREG